MISTNHILCSFTKGKRVGKYDIFTGSFPALHPEIAAAGREEGSRKLFRKGATQGGPGSQGLYNIAQIGVGGGGSYRNQSPVCLSLKQLKASGM